MIHISLTFHVFLADTTNSLLMPNMFSTTGKKFHLRREDYEPKISTAYDESQYEHREEMSNKGKKNPKNKVNINCQFNIG